MTGRAMRKTAMPRGRPPRPRRLRQRRKERGSRRKRRSSVVSAQDVREAAAGLAGVAIRTPLRFIETLNVYLKLESLQPIGAFKLRGAYNAVRRLPEATRRNGVITYSSGNHGQALAYAAQLVGVRAVVVMPETAPAGNGAGVKERGGEGRGGADRRRRRARAPPRPRPARRGRRGRGGAAGRPAGAGVRPSGRRAAAPRSRARRCWCPWAGAASSPAS